MSEEQPRHKKRNTGVAGVGAGVQIGDDCAIPGTLWVAKRVVGVGMGHIASAVDIDG